MVGNWGVDFRNRKLTLCKRRQILRMQVISYLLNVDSANSPPMGRQADRAMHSLATPVNWTSQIFQGVTKDRMMH